MVLGWRVQGVGLRIRVYAWYRTPCKILFFKHPKGNDISGTSGPQTQTVRSGVKNKHRQNNGFTVRFVWASSQQSHEWRRDLAVFGEILYASQDLMRLCWLDAHTKRTWFFTGRSGPSGTYVSGLLFLWHSRLIKRLPALDHTLWQTDWDQAATFVLGLGIQWSCYDKVQRTTSRLRRLHDFYDFDFTTCDLEGHDLRGPDLNGAPPKAPQPDRKSSFQISKSWASRSQVVTKS